MSSSQNYVNLTLLNSEPIMLDVCSLNFEYPDKPLLHEVQFMVKPGSLLHLRGNNGSGKTTLLKLLAGILQPLDGDIRYHGKLITDDLPSYQKNICFVGHKAGISPLLTVQENCKFDLHKSRCNLSIEELITSFGLDEFKDTPCSLLSAGQKRRVALLRLLMSDASLWLLDEPLVALDNDALLLFMTHLNNHLISGGIVVLTSHQSLPDKPENYQEYYLC